MLRKRCHRHGIRISYDLQREDLRVLYRYCLPALIAGMSYIPAVWASNAALARAAGYVETGLFQAAFHWQTVSLFLAVGVGNVGFPMLAANLRSHRSYVRVLAGNFSLTTGLTVASALLVAVAAPYIARLYGPQFNNATTVIRIMSACGVLIAINISAGQIIWSLDAASAAMLFELFRGTLLVAASVLLAGRGASGLAWAHLITAAGMTITEVPFCLLRLRALNRENSRVASSLAVPVTN
jgi:O-antigen/teichoic acid export membrane protein